MPRVTTDATAGPAGGTVPDPEQGRPGPPAALPTAAVVSVVVPTHGRPDLLREACEAVLAQTTPPAELLVVDDLDDPATRAVVDGLAARGGTLDVRYLSRTDRPGASASRNDGAAAARGDLLAFCDDDDTWEPGLLAAALAARGEADAVFVRLRAGHHVAPELRTGLAARDVVARNPGVTGSNIVVSRTAFDRTGGFDEELAGSNDKDFLVRFLSSGGTYAVVQEPLVGVRRHEGARLTRPTAERLEALRRYYDRHAHLTDDTGRRYLRGVMASTERHLATSRSRRALLSAQAVAAWGPSVAVQRVRSRAERGPLAVGYLPTSGARAQGAAAAEEPARPTTPEETARSHTRGCLPTLEAVRLYLRADLHRYRGSGITGLARHLLVTPGFQYTFWLRLTGWAKVQPAPVRLVAYPVLKAVLLHYRHKYHFGIPEHADIGPGLYIHRLGGVHVHGDAVVGHDLTIGHMTLLGQTNRGARAGAPLVGDRVYVAVGASVIGHVRVGDDVAVGTSAVVTRDVEPGTVVAGVPARVVSSTGGSEGYVHRQVPAALLAACYAARDAGAAGRRAPAEG